MVFKSTYLSVAGTCGILWVRAFHIYGGHTKRCGYIKDFVKVSAKIVESSEWGLRGVKYKGFVLHTKFGFTKKDGTVVRFKVNSSILLKKRMNVLGTIIIGPGLVEIFRPKFLQSFVGVI
jgi:ribosomal protein L14